MQTLPRTTTIRSRAAFIVLLATLFGATTMGTRIFYKGPNRDNAVCNFAGNILYEGVNQSAVAANWSGGALSKMEAASLVYALTH